MKVNADQSNEDIQKEIHNHPKINQSDNNLDLDEIKMERPNNNAPLQQQTAQPISNQEILKTGDLSQKKKIINHILLQSLIDEKVSNETLDIIETQINANL